MAQRGKSGLLPATLRVLFTLGVDVVGVVDELGAEVSTVELGQGVAGATFSLGGLDEIASEYNHELVSALGATPIDYRTQNFVRRIRRVTGDGVDVVFDPIGGARQLWRSHRALRKGGRLVSFGVAATKKKGLLVIPLTLLVVALLKLIPDGKQMPLAPDLGEDNAWYQETLTKVLDLLAMGRIKPVVVERIPLTEAVRAHELLARGGYAGKVVLVTSA